MGFEATTKNIRKVLTPLGFKVEIDSQIDDEDYLQITHPNHSGIVIEAAVLNNDKEFDALSREVQYGPESDLSKGYSQAEFDALTQAQKDHLYHIDFGEELNYDSIDSDEDFVKLIQEKIIPITVL
jgi:hypothetical protein